MSLIKLASLKLVSKSNGQSLTRLVKSGLDKIEKMPKKQQFDALSSSTQRLFHKYPGLIKLDRRNRTKFSSKTKESIYGSLIKKNEREVVPHIENILQNRKIDI